MSKRPLIAEGTCSLVESEGWSISGDERCTDDTTASTGLMGAVLIGVASVVLTLVVLVPLKASAFQPTQVSANWDVIGVGPKSRSLDLAYTISGCLGPGVHTVVSETRSTITVGMLEDAQIPGAGEGCTRFLGERQTVVRLAAPLNGRRILGRPAMPPGDLHVGMVTTKGGLRVPMPRLVGFAPADAKHALQIRNLHVRVGRTRSVGRARVVTQDPAPGTLVTQAATVRIQVGLP